MVKDIRHYKIEKNHYTPDEVLEKVINILLSFRGEKNEKGEDESMKRCLFLSVMLATLPKDVVDMVEKEFLFVTATDNAWIDRDKHDCRHIFLIPEKLIPMDTEEMQKRLSSMYYAISAVYKGRKLSEVTEEEAMSEIKQQADKWYKDVLDSELVDYFAERIREKEDQDKERKVE